jgi:hypothetical protein
MVLYSKVLPIPPEPSKKINSFKGWGSITTVVIPWRTIWYLVLNLLTYSFVKLMFELS